MDSGNRLLCLLPGCRVKITTCSGSVDLHLNLREFLLLKGVGNLVVELFSNTD